MVEYNPKDWLVFIFRFHKSDTFRRLLPMMITIGLYTWGVLFLELQYWKLAENSLVRNTTVLHTTLGFVISLLLAYRTNTAYERWWEGRKLWGSLVNVSRSLSMKLAAMLPDASDKAFYRAGIPLFARELSAHLRGRTLPQPPAPFDIDVNNHRPNAIASLLIARTVKLGAAQTLSNHQMIMLNGDLQTMVDVCGACERIKATPIPYSYSAFIKKFIFIYIMTLPYGFVFSLGYFAIPVVIFIFYVLASLELIAEEIEDPFGSDTNDLPTEQLAANIERQVQELI
jgi:ion channel-forming bestrophin family protein